MMKRIIEVATKIAEASEEFGRDRRFNYLLTFHSAIYVLADCPEFSEPRMSGDVSFLKSANVGKSTDTVPLSGLLTHNEIKENILVGRYDDGEIIPLPVGNIWLSPVDSRPHFVDDEGWIYARGYQPVTGNTVIVREVIDDDGNTTLTRTSAKYFSWLKVVRFKIEP